MHYVASKKENIFSPLQVKNKPRDGEMEHVFILGSMDCMIVNTMPNDIFNKIFLTQLAKLIWMLPCSTISASRKLGTLLRNHFLSLNMVALSGILLK
jgi:hypothetical protein